MFDELKVNRLQKFLHETDSAVFFVWICCIISQWVDMLITSCNFTGRGGQSAPRFARIRQEKRHNYITKVAETAVQLFITSDQVNVSGLILAGSAELKTELSKSDMFDPVSFLLPYYDYLKIIFIKML